MQPKKNDFLSKLGIFLSLVLVVCLFMIATTYHQLQEIEKAASSNEKKAIETRLDEMIRKMERK